MLSHNDVSRTLSASTLISGAGGSHASIFLGFKPAAQIPIPTRAMSNAMKHRLPMQINHFTKLLAVNRNKDVREGTCVA